MTHLDPDELALLALGEAGSADAAAHLDECPECAQQLVELGHAAGLGRQSRSLTLEAPPAEVWDRIRGELALGAPGTAAPVAPVTALPVGRHRPSRRRPRSRRLLPAALVGLAALVVGVVGGVWLQASRGTDAVVVARADLEAFPAWQGASGSAELEDADGERELVVHLDAEGAADTYREVWLIADDATGLVGLGVLDGADGRFTVPAGIDLAEYSLVDISQEPDDGDPEHSGDSIVRGPLREG
ncbi:anti-sigma factor [Rathayibacter sp. VKM Ac-2856]|uniref:anti-sigma factor n=1 Tax=unclassified Rathayibacter TaxID=2609250 RepID=UPI001563BCB2|nr:MULTISPECIES: anti-sigma factor [unclassified Rathayibacter]NQX06218.1 anti-sigma factor [Rathayibacter sp. VKM Ac-2858]NQX21385.1 anti-sigma factor [Rathayibacter sp. VKM Ac-2856]